MNKKEIIRRMQYAGSWYESDPDLLRAFIAESLADAEVRNTETFLEGQTGACLAMLPHAGLLYSARGIADFFANIPVKTTNILIIAPSHYVHILPDSLTTADFTLAETPLADLKVMPLHDLLPGRVVHCDRKAVELEHALEMFLPFCANLQLHSSKDIRVGLCLISQVTSEKSIEMLSEAILEAIGNEHVLNGETLIIASSDFTHYGNRFGYTPFKVASYEAQEVEEQVLLHDRNYAEKFAAGDIKGLLSLQVKDQPTICGFAPGLIVSNIAKQLNLTGKITNQYTSNSITGVSSDFVSYCSILWR
ncbi:MAG: AmmeMemoRadiSam system protein B [Bacteroidetes bacterium]|nr:AmmeMemoRadiSam system protein B [Bacteroidota bacterium]